MDEKLAGLFKEWLEAFEAIQARRIKLAATPAEVPLGLAVKLGLHQFLNDHADPASVQVNSAYSDLVRLTGHDPKTEICTRFEREAA